MNAHRIIEIEAPRPLLITVSLLDRMYRSGALDSVGRVELRDGVLYEMNSQNVPHARTKSDLGYELNRVARPLGLDVIIEVSVELDDFNLPMPDILVCRFTDVDGPAPVEAARIVIEVSDTTLADDIGRKRLKYAGANIPEYWVVDVLGRIVVLHADVADGDYGRKEVVRFGEPLVALTIPGLKVDTSVLR